MHQSDAEIDFLSVTPTEVADLVVEKPFEVEYICETVAGVADLLVGHIVGLTKDTERLRDHQSVVQLRFLRALADCSAGFDAVGVCLQCPTRICISIDFPDPFSPTIPTISPA